MTKKYDPATGEQYDPETIHTKLYLRPPFTGFCYDRLRTALRTAPQTTEAYLDNVLTRLEAKTTTNGNCIPFPHQNRTVTIPIRSKSEAMAVETAFTVDPTTCTAPLCEALLTQLNGGKQHVQDS